MVYNKIILFFIITHVNIKTLALIADGLIE
jgi:hypothetical protein